MKQTLQRFKQRMQVGLMKALLPVSSGGWIPLINESFLGAWQTDTSVTAQTALTHPTVYACVTQVAADIGKLRVRVVQEKSGIMRPARSPALNAILKKPNKFQTRQKFVENWLLSKLTSGNTYALKLRNPAGKVQMLYVLDPLKVQPLVAENGDVFYKVQADHLTGVHKDIDAIPASEIMHDTMECLFHPLIGLPPLYAAALAVLQGINMQKASTYFFANGARPGGILTAPGKISVEAAGRIKEYWSTNYSGENAGKVAVLGDGLSYEQLTVNADDAQLVEQLKWSDEKICSVYKVPPYKVHVGPPPTYQQSETLDRKYYSDCLQRLMESFEALMSDGLEMPAKYGVEFVLDDLMRMDMNLKMRTYSEGVKGGILAPNEAREKFNLEPKKGGDTPYLQQQNYSLAALDERDRNNPLVVDTVPPPAPPAPEGSEPEVDDTDKALHLLFRKDVEEVIANGV